MLQRFLDPTVLAGISGLDLVARTVVDGFVAGLYRSPDFGFRPQGESDQEGRGASQEEQNPPGGQRSSVRSS